MDQAFKIEDILLKYQMITNAQLEEAIRLQKSLDTNRSIKDCLMSLDYITDEKITQATAHYLKIPYKSLKKCVIDQDVIDLLDEKLVRKYQVVPLEKKLERITVGMVNPMDFYALEEIRLSTHLVVQVVMCTKADIEAVIKYYYSGGQASTAAKKLNDHYYNIPSLDLIKENSEPDIIQKEPIIQVVNGMVEQALKLGASDIHIEPEKNQVRIRMRIDGTLYEKMILHKNIYSDLITRIKIMGNMNIAERRLPQDGRFHFEKDVGKVDVRVSVLPTLYGEKVVLRILNMQEYVIDSIDQLGLSDLDQKVLNQMIHSPNGMILVTGPTGSGKSTTLYTILKTLNQGRDNIITLEDPVEKEIVGVNQVQMNSKIGLTFSKGLRAILRQDPDIIMLGEIRDSETASIATRAAITGHLVLSTLHTNDAVSTIMRLVDMGVESYLVSASLVGVMAQRLVRRLCPLCRKAYTSSLEEMKTLGVMEVQTLYQAEGCQACGFTGYKGRTAIYEIIHLDNQLRQMIHEGCQMNQLKGYAKSRGTIFLKDHMRQCVLEGHTSMDEYRKIACYE